MKWIVVACFLVVSTLANPTPAEYGACPEDEYLGLTCTIDSVTVEGCRKDRNSKACKVKRNVVATINIDFTPTFNGNATLMAYALLPGVEKAFPDMDPNACNGYMMCPVVASERTSYSFGLKLAPSYPLGLFNVRFLLKSLDDMPQCCLVTKFRIEK